MCIGQVTYRPRDPGEWEGTGWRCVTKDSAGRYKGAWLGTGLIKGTWYRARPFRPPEVAEPPEWHPGEWDWTYPRMMGYLHPKGPLGWSTAGFYVWDTRAGARAYVGGLHVQVEWVGLLAERRVGSHVCYQVAYMRYV